MFTWIKFIVAVNWVKHFISKQDVEVWEAFNRVEITAIHFFQFKRHLHYICHSFLSIISFKKCFCCPFPNSFKLFRNILGHWVHTSTFNSDKPLQSRTWFSPWAACELHCTLSLWFYACKIIISGLVPNKINVTSLHVYRLAYGCIHSLRRNLFNSSSNH